MTGGGKYAKAASVARQVAKAGGIILFVVDGEHGDGFEVEIADSMTPLVLGMLPKMLRITADNLEKDWKSQNNR